MPKISYKVTLSQKERDKLHETSHSGKRATRVILTALVLLAVDRGDFQTVKQSERDIAKTLHISPCTINNIKKRFIAPRNNAEFVADMEKVLSFYKRPYNEKYPVVCFDGMPWLIG